MKTFILLSFGFLAWAFYEMSGGEDFEPASERLARLEPETNEAPESAEAEAEVASLPEAPQANTLSFVDTDPPLENEVTRVSLDLTTLGEVISEEQAAAEAEALKAAEAEIEAEKKEGDE